MDTDGDNVPDTDDNCVETGNPEQLDADEDGLGDACDACVNDADNDIDIDIDGDGLCADVDSCPGVANPEQLDADGDGWGDACPCEEGARGALARALADFDPDLFLVDHFWVGVHHLVPQLKCPSWLIVHTVPRVWFNGPPKMPFERTRYARVIGTEPMEHHRLDDMVSPVVIVNPDECHPPSALRALFDVPEDKRLVLLAHTGLKQGREVGELEADLRLAPDEVLVSMSMHRDKAIFPLAPYLPGADRIIGGGGYNFFWETQWLGLGARTRYQPFHRTPDNQRWRMRHLQGHTMLENGADQLARQMMAGAG